MGTVHRLSLRASQLAVMTGLVLRYLIDQEASRHVQGPAIKEDDKCPTGRPLPGPKLIVGRGWKLCGNVLKETHSQRTAGRGSPN